MKITTQAYGQFLVNGVNNFTGTYFAEIVEGLTHDSVYRHLIPMCDQVRSNNIEYHLFYKVFL
jgi:hypothetical protein